MKKIICILTATLLLTATGIGAQAQKKENCTDYKKQLITEKIAFFTTELELTPEEAQAFWPVYNQIQQEHKEAFARVKATFNKLHNAIEQGRSETEIAAAMKAYAEALDGSHISEAESMERYCKVLPMAKVARLYVAEETFRKMQIRKVQQMNATN